MYLVSVIHLEIWDDIDKTAAKHAVLYHGGTISAFIRPEGGLGFEFTLMKKLVADSMKDHTKGI